jgi:hypothetical protein
VLLTQSWKAAFQGCRRRARYRYRDRLVAYHEAAELRFGSLVHTGLEAHFKRQDPHAAIDKSAIDSNDKAQAHAILSGYALRYSREDFEVIAIESAFVLPLLHGEGAGKWDGVVRRKDGLWILEHKTASRIDAAYLSRLWVDFQIAWYAAAAEFVFREPVRGIIYDVIEKLPRDQRDQNLGETDAEWEARRAEAKQPNRLKRRTPESLDEYAARLDAAYRAPERFHREEILLSRDDLALAIEEMNEIAFEWGDAIARNAWPRNTNQCFVYGKPCSYLPICQSRENPVVIANQYRIEDPNRELAPPPEPELAF